MKLRVRNDGERAVKRLRAQAFLDGRELRIAGAVVYPAVPPGGNASWQWRLGEITDFASSGNTDDARAVLEPRMIARLSYGRRSATIAYGEATTVP